MNEQFKYDVFVSYSAKDKRVAHELAERLRQNEVLVWLDDWQIHYGDWANRGDRANRKIKQGLEQSRNLVLIMSANAFSSEWPILERHTALFRDLTDHQRRFIPILLDNTKVPDALKHFAYIDWPHWTEEQFQRLVMECKPPLAEDRVEVLSKLERRMRGGKLLIEHPSQVTGVAVTANGRLVVSGSHDSILRAWDPTSGRCLAQLKGHTNTIFGVAMTPDGRRAVSGSSDGTIQIWDLATVQHLGPLGVNLGIVRGLAVTSNGKLVVSGTGRSIKIWDLESKTCLQTLEGHAGPVLGVAITSDGGTVVSCSGDKTIRVWDWAANKCTAILEGHTNWVSGLALSADEKLVVSGSKDGTVRAWDLLSLKCIATLEGHTDWVNGVALAEDGNLVVSGSKDGTVKAWDLDSGQCLNTFSTRDISPNLYGDVNAVAITPDGSTAISGSTGGIIIWDLRAFGKVSTQSPTTTRYTNAKVLLVGESTVGKTGLALRLTENRFEPTISTDAAWATQMLLPNDINTGSADREIWLWDFAGQSDYRLIHQLFMDETALAVLVFNPQSDNPFEGIGQWDRDLVNAAQRKFGKLLVAGRCDRGGLRVSRDSINRIISERGFLAYLETSALTGNGCPELKKAIIDHIPWGDIPWTASPRIFKLLKEEIVKLKDEGKVLLRMPELKQQLEMRMPGERFTSSELRAVVGLLVGPGVVWKLEFGDFVLLQPERINAYAAAVIRTVRAHKDEIGCITEELVLAGDLDYEDMKRLPRDEEEIVLRAMHQTLVDHSLCLRENTEDGTLLIFPSYFNRDRPHQEEHPLPFVTYQFSGMIDEIYSTLVVRLHHTTFEKDQLWRFAADFKTMAGQRIGLKMTPKLEGAAEITVYCEPDISVETKAAFIRYVHEHLKAKDPEVKRERHYTCGICQSSIEDRRAVKKRLSRGLKDILCVNCENRILLWDLIEDKFASEETQAEVREMEEQARRAIDNESRELILVGHALAIAGEAGQIFRPVANSDWGIDGEIEFKDNKGRASGERVYLQLKSGDSYLYERKDGSEVFNIKKERHAEYWQLHKYPVMLVIRTSDERIRWMNVTEYLRKQGKAVKQIVFDGEPFTASNLWRMRDRVLGARLIETK